MFHGSMHCLSGSASPKAAAWIGCTATLMHDMAALSLIEVYPPIEWVSKEGKEIERKKKEGK